MAKGIASIWVIFIARASAGSVVPVVGSVAVCRSSPRASRIAEHAGDQGGGVVAAPGEGELGGGRRRATSRNTTPVQRGRRDALGDQGDAEAGGDEREQHGGAGRLVLAVRGEPGGSDSCASTASLHGRVRVGVHHEDLGAQVAGRDDRLVHQPVVGRQGHEQALHHDGPQLELLAGDRRAQHPDVEAAVTQARRPGQG